MVILLCYFRNYFYITSIKISSILP